MSCKYPHPRMKTSIPLLMLSATLLVPLWAGNLLATPGMHFDGSGRETPWTNCTLCHGADLQGGVGPACVTCHKDFSEPDPPPTGHHFPGREDPLANNCTLCHGSELTGDIGPSCFTCHDQLWNGGGGGNVPPVIDVGGPYAGVVGVAVDFDASGTTDADGDTQIYLWIFGDGSKPPFPSELPTTSHVYEKAGTFTAVLSVTDGVNLPEIVDVEVVITNGSVNLPPVADPGGPYAGIAGQAAQFDGSGSEDPEDDVLDYEWDFGDGSPTVAGLSPLASHTYAAAGTYTVTLSVSDGINLPVSETVQIEVAPPNLPPVADAGGPYSGETGTPVQFDGSGSSDVDGDALQYTWDFGDGSLPVSGASATASHSYSAAGTYTAMLLVSDGVNSPVSQGVNVEITDDSNPPNPPSGNGWTIRLPLIPAEGTLDLDSFAGFLFVTEDFGSDGQAFGIGFRVGSYVIWIDGKGALFMGSENGHNMVGLVLNFMGSTNSLWFAEQAAGADDPAGLLGGLFGQFL